MRGAIASFCIATHVLAAAPLIVVQPLEIANASKLLSKKSAEELKADFWRMVAKTGVAFVDTDAECRKDDECLRGSAIKTNTMYALSAKLEVAEAGTVKATTRIVRNDGEAVKSSDAEASLKPDNFAEIGRVALAQSIEQLGLAKLPKADECVPDKAWRTSLYETLHDLGTKAANKYENPAWEKCNVAEKSARKLIDDASTAAECQNARKAVFKFKRDFKL
jgi:hypothetical protein